MWEVREGDCLGLLGEVADGSIDAVATDPPYGISFMQRAWDRALPDPAVWRECLRVLKPGGSAVVMSGARLDCLWRMCRDLEEAGFELSQSALSWVYRSGFPKGQDLSKAADAEAGAERESLGPRPHPDGHTRCPGGTWGTPGVLGLGNLIDTLGNVSIPASPLAQALDGWYTKGKVKPAWELIIWARKPISERTELANMVAHGVGGVNCGACMVPTAEPRPLRDGMVQTGAVNWGNGTISGGSRAIGETTAGRYPANLLCTDDALGEGSRYFCLDTWAAEHGFTEDGWVDAAAAGLLQVAKPSRAERNAGCEVLPHAVETQHGFKCPVCNICGSRTVTSGPGPTCGHDDFRWEKAIKADQHHGPLRNPHPTCKPVRLFAYLVSFLTRPGALVLDPYLGSGTTGVACVQAGRDFLGMELDPAYCEIARARIAHAEREAKDKQSQLALQTQEA